ncbi:aminotransferase class V-fold PLP-dependent enzyme [Gallaecimonas kandeliae]|uniref:aminotransferase class V-fold PLP-dependent enzyme n=1 Tax=Gallaecimonas kandeliae TaxID=3029055 RepID=UPI002649BBA9|nr:aminotransferase class V-fold PLP-dependent enzyme [Gallaecimonas kandeliae]WKE64993.1 aminotransferase class V-fold PLP-dependent enzyme [Gallaecimonas kandeliae]
MLKQHYSRFLAQHQGQQHYACHSHHYWPDVTREAQLAYWDDTARYVDDKWGYFFREKVPAVQAHIAHILKLPDAAQLAFAPNTHEFVVRLLSCLPSSRKWRILTTDSEFHSFSRQCLRLEEGGLAEVVRVPTQPFTDFEQRFASEAAKGGWDLVFFSQVFFNSGFAVRDLKALVDAVPDADTLVAVDGYHGFCALPTDISDIAGRAFYLAGSYKYAQGGEGCCFMAVPKGCELRPVNTGWYAEFGALHSARSNQVAYAEDGLRFAGATMDLSALYRLLAVLDWWQRDGISVEAIHGHVQQLQQAFLAQLDEIGSPLLHRGQLQAQDLSHHGHFLTFELADGEATGRLADFLASHGIHTDYRGNRLRFGFAPYHEVADIDLSALKEL